MVLPLMLILSHPSFLCPSLTSPPPPSSPIIAPSDPQEMEYEEAVSKTTLQQVIRDLEPSTSYTFYVKAYTSHGASKPSESVTESTHGEGEQQSLHVVHKPYLSHIRTQTAACYSNYHSLTASVL